MSDRKLLIHPFCFPSVLDDLNRSAVKEIAPDVWFIEGYIGSDFFQAPASSNVFILRDKDLVFLFDTGAQPFYRERILKILRKYSKMGAKTLVLMNSQGHWDHVMNNEIIWEAGFPTVRFLLPEPEIPVIELSQHWFGDARKLENYVQDPFDGIDFVLKLLEQEAQKYPAYGDPEYREVWQVINNLSDQATRGQKRHALKIYMNKIMLGDYQNMAETAEILPLESREKKWIGPVNFMGWQVGRFFVIHDASHSPGHVSLYDPENKLMLTGDATVEINPPFYDGSMEKLLDLSLKCRILAEQGFIEIATDAHQSEKHFYTRERMNLMGVEPLHEVQLKEIAVGEDECAAFFRMYEDYYRDLMAATMDVHKRINEATVEEIVAELGKETNKNVVFKMALGLPHAPSRPSVMVANILRESGAIRRVVDGKILFTPAQKWNFLSS